MGSMKGKQAKINAAFGRLADMIPSGHLLASMDPVGFLDAVASELKDLRAENVKLNCTGVNVCTRNNPMPLCSPDSPEWTFRATAMINAFIAMREALLWWIECSECFEPNEELAAICNAAWAEVERTLEATE